MKVVTLWYNGITQSFGGLKFQFDSERRYLFDHICPKSKGGTNDIENLQPMCEICNVSKDNEYNDSPCDPPNILLSSDEG